MGFKIKNLGTPFRDFTANVGPVNLTAGVPIAEMYLGMYAQHVLTAATTLGAFLNEIDEVTVTRRGETIVSIENGSDLMALELAPWNDHSCVVTIGGSSAHYLYVKGLALPCNYPIGVSGEFQLTVETSNTAGFASEVLSIAEGQGIYRHNYFGHLQDLNTKHFHIVKRLYTPAGTGWNSGFDIGTEGDLVGLLLYQTTEEEGLVEKTSISMYELQLDIGGETVLKADCLTQQGRMSRSAASNSETTNQSLNDPKAAVFDQYVYIDFARQPWDCRGKTVTLSTNAGTADAIRAYPIYLVDA